MPMNKSILTIIHSRSRKTGSKCLIQNVSYVGYITEEINVSGRASIDVLFTEDVHAIDELVVFGYGTQKKTGFI